MDKQQKQTLKYFKLNSKAKNWYTQAVFSKAKIKNSVFQRNNFVLDYLKNKKNFNYLDIGCGTGNLVNEVARYAKFSHGIDFSNSMISIANKKFNKKNIKFDCLNFLNFKPDVKYDYISANGFIEYFSEKDLKKIFRILKKSLKKNGRLIFGSRNRLFNIFSLNKFTSLEIRSKTILTLLEEALMLTNMPYNNYKKKKGLNFKTIKYNQPKTGVNVDLINQYTPLQIIGFIKKFKFDAISISPVNYHSVLPKFKDNQKLAKKFNSLIISKNMHNSDLIPYSSTFMVIAKNK